jgi:branched-chain amino acid transport system ATP-binding protein
MLQLEGIEVFYGTFQGLFGVNLRVDQGEVVALLGRNGMGKTTTVRAIMGLTPPRRGRISFDDNNLERLPPFRIAQLGIGLVPEGRQIFPTLTLRENLLATASRHVHDGHQAWHLERVFALFPTLAERQNHQGFQLSGGEQQMLAIGRALMTNPRLLILDEATEGLAPRIRADIWQSLADLKKTGLSVLIIDKNIMALSRICDRHYILANGQVAWQGTSRQLLEQPALRHQYLGV